MTGNTYGSGYFSNQYVDIAHPTGLASPTATFIFSQQKSGRDPGTIFSNLSGQSGYEIGINAANKLYFNHYINGEPAINTLNIIPGEKNIYGVTLGNGAVNMFRMNPANSGSLGFYTFQTQSFSIPPYGVTTTSEWRLGSGEYNYKGWMDYFLYFNKVLPVEKLKWLANSLYRNYSFTGPITGRTTPFLTGAGTSGSGVTGIGPGVGLDHSPGPRRCSSERSDHYSNTCRNGD